MVSVKIRPPNSYTFLSTFTPRLSFHSTKISGSSGYQAFLCKKGLDLAEFLLVHICTAPAKGMIDSSSVT